MNLLYPLEALRNFCHLFRSKDFRLSFQGKMNFLIATRVGTRLDVLRSYFDDFYTSSCIKYKRCIQYTSIIYERHINL